MSNLTPDLFSEDVDVPDIPPRSTLYRCPILEEGTSQQESLLNYVHRLARVHNLGVMDLLVRIVLPSTQVNVDRGRYKFAREYARTVNGYGKYAREVSTALQTLTGTKDLKSSTFLYWRNLFDRNGIGLLHPTRTWCPDCLAEAEERGDPHNFPLQWACSSVTHCQTHLCKLQSKCLKCGAAQQPICDSSHYGRCAACGASLAWRSTLFRESPISDRQRFFSDAIGEMIALGPQARNILHTANFANGLRRVVEATNRGSVAALAKSLYITKTTLREWEKGTKPPRLNGFLELCYRIGVKPVDLCTSEVPFPLVLRFVMHPPSRPNFRLTQENLLKVQTEINHNLHAEVVPISLAELARKHGTSVGHLRYRLPDACSALLFRRSMIRSMIADAKHDDRIRRAIKIARRLFEQDMHLPRTRVQRALADEGLCIKCPETREAAYGEIQRLTEEAFQKATNAHRLGLDVKTSDQNGPPD